MIDDVVQINPQSEAMGRSHQAEKVLLRAIARGDRTALVFVAQIEWIEQIVPY